jgi:hypothetical protein
MASGNIQCKNAEMLPAGLTHPSHAGMIGELLAPISRGLVQPITVTTTDAKYLW